MATELVVADSGPLIALARIGRLELLPGLYQKIRVPRAVFTETTEGDRAGSSEIRGASWLEVIDVDEVAVAPLLLSVDRGEAEAMVLARSLSDATLLVDDARGRVVARRLGLRVRGTIGVLLQAKAAGLIASVRECLDALESVGAFVGRELRAEALRLADEP
jgi:predicted nucleic acid-binding protein